MKPMVILNLYKELDAIKNHFPCLGEISPLLVHYNCDILWSFVFIGRSIILNPFLFFSCKSEGKNNQKN